MRPCSCCRWLARGAFSDAPRPSPLPFAVRAAATSSSATTAEPTSVALRPPRTSNQLKTLIVANLQARKPRRALHLFKSVLDSPSSSASTARTAEGLAWLFFSYRNNDAALEAVFRMHERGYRIPVPLATKVLNSSYHDLVLHPEKLDVVFQWLKGGISGGTEEMQPEVVESLLGVLRKMGRDDWVMDLFETYRATLAEGEVGHERVWSSVISTLGESGDLEGAKRLFYEWRDLWLETHPSLNMAASPPPPEPPYLALLDQLSASTKTVPASKAPSYAFLPLLARDGLPPTTRIYNSMLNLELSRRAFTSFWGLWSTMSDSSPCSSPSNEPPKGPSRNMTTWALAIRALLVSSSLPRSRSRLHVTPLVESAPHQPTKAPTYRSLLSHLLSASLDQVSRQPSRVLPSAALPILWTSTLNAFLALLVRVGDYKAATIVLETFRVRRLEPDEETHSAVVMGVVRNWERGRLGGNLKAEEERLGWGWQAERDGIGRSRKVRERWTREKRKEAGLDMMGAILKGRKMRMNLWTRPELSELEEVTLDPEAAEHVLEGAVLDGTEDGVAVGGAGRPAPDWMVKRELRDVEYLVTLLRRCEGLDDESWASEMRLARDEILPQKKRSLGKVGQTRYSHDDRLKAWKRGASVKELKTTVTSRGRRYRESVRT